MKKLLMLTFLILSSSVFAEEVDPDPTGDYDAFCLEIKHEDSLGMKKILRDMTTTNYSVDSYFEHSLCQPAGYSNVVKCPMIHLIADDPEKNERKLQDLWLYYSVERSEPSIFTKIINAKNTDNQTLLDYIEYLTIKRGGYGQGALVYVKRIKEMLCSHGAVYSFYSKSCSSL